MFKSSNPYLFHLSNRVDVYCIGDILTGCDTDHCSGSGWINPVPLIEVDLPTIRAWGLEERETKSDKMRVEKRNMD